MNRKLILLTFASGFFLNLAVIFFLGRWNTPPPPGDGQDYDNLAWNLAQGKGYGYEWEDSRWRLPYEEHNQSGTYNDILARRTAGFEATSTRPPLLPFILAAIYKIFGRHFWIWNLLNAAMFALVGAYSVGLAQKFFGFQVARFTALAVILDFSYKWFSADLLTEAFACLLTLGITHLLFQFWRKGNIKSVVFAGILAGLSFLLRSIFIFWFPLLTLFIFFIGPSRRKLLGSALFLVCALCVTAPWMVRNCKLHQAFMPLGDQGGIKLPGGYCDAALAGNGMWADPKAGGYFADFEKQLATRNLSIGEYNRELAAYGSACAKQWMRSHWQQLPRLALGKLGTELRLGYGYLLPFLLIAILGILTGTLGLPQAQMLWFFVILNALPIMATWSVGGRLLLPVVPHLHILFGSGLAGILGWISPHFFKVESSVE